MNPPNMFLMLPGQSPAELVAPSAKWHSCDLSDLEAVLGRSWKLTKALNLRMVQELLCISLGPVVARVSSDNSAPVAATMGALAHK